MSRCLLLGVGIAFGCGGALRASEADPVAGDHLSAIRIAGNQAIATDALEPALALHEAIRDGAAPDPYLLSVDTERIRAAYVRRGFFAASVTARVDPSPGGRGQVVTFHVVEGGRANAVVEIAGLPPEVPAERARALVALRDGEPFDYLTYDAAKQPLRTLIENAGYARADVRAMVVAEPGAAIARVRYEIAPGPRCTFGAIRFTGTSRPALLEAARARLGFAPGDRYSARALEAAQLEISDIGRFSRVQVAPDRGGGGAVVDVSVELAEATRHEVHAGVGVGVDPEKLEPRVRGGYSQVPAGLPLLTWGLDGRVSYVLTRIGSSPGDLRSRVLAQVSYLDLFRPRLRGELEGGVDYQTVEAYTWIGEHVRVGLASPLGVRWLSLRVGWVLEHLSFTGIADALQGDIERTLGLDHPQLRGAYQAQLVADLRDSVIEPRAGVYFALPVTEGTPLAGGDLTYHQVTPEVRGYVPLGASVLAARARVGAILGDVPPTERYFSGGPSGHRGFADRRLSPAIDSVVIGGAGLIETGIELRRAIGSLWGVPLGGTVFLDGGDVTTTAEELDVANLQWAVGGALWTRFGGTSGLKFGGDVGYRLNRQSSDPGALANLSFHLDVGDAF
ncbi:MAG TPA: BamA/TamA family outer membrane protein [Kofleriaceae bacterium]|nr:BamA/TamA family outer membrane protein [Kofleriaceae bacterium]